MVKEEITYTKFHTIAACAIVIIFLLKIINYNADENSTNIKNLNKQLSSTSTLISNK